MRTRAREKEQRGAMEKEMRIWGGKVKKKHLRSLPLKLFHLMVLKGIDGQREEGQEEEKREEGKIK